MFLVTLFLLVALCACHAQALDCLDTGCTFSEKDGDWSTEGTIDINGVSKGTYEMHVLHSETVNKYAYKASWFRFEFGEYAWIMIETVTGGLVTDTVKYKSVSGTCTILTNDEVESLPAGLEYGWKSCVPMPEDFDRFENGRYYVKLPEVWDGNTYEVKWDFDLSNDLDGDGDADCFPTTDVFSYYGIGEKMTFTHSSMTVGTPSDDAFPCPPPSDDDDDK